jgi:hypothetical protein
MIATILALIIPASLFIFIFPKLIIYILAGSKYYGAIPIFANDHFNSVLRDRLATSLVQRLIPLENLK